MPQVRFKEPKPGCRVRRLTGLALIFKPALSADARFLDIPTFVDFFTGKPADGCWVQDNFLAMDPNRLQTISECVLSGCPTYQTECTEEIRFLAYVLVQNKV
jgi:hypothetical protein